MSTQKEPSREEIAKAWSEMGKVSDRIREGKQSFRSGVWELMQGGSKVGNAVNWIIHTTSPEDRAQVKDEDDYGMSDEDYFLQWHLHQEAEEKEKASRADK